MHDNVDDTANDLHKTNNLRNTDNLHQADDDDDVDFHEPDTANYDDALHDHDASNYNVDDVLHDNVDDTANDLHKTNNLHNPHHLHNADDDDLHYLLRPALHLDDHCPVQV